MDCQAHLRAFSNLSPQPTFSGHAVDKRPWLGAEMVRGPRLFNLESAAGYARARSFRGLTSPIDRSDFLSTTVPRISR